MNALTPLLFGRQRWRKSPLLVLLLAQLGSLAACASASMHSEAELNQVALVCGLSIGEVVQEQDAKGLLFLYRIAPAPAQRHCVYQWAHKNHLNLVVINAVNDPATNEPHS